MYSGSARTGEDVMPRRMFGVLGLFKDSVVFGIISRMDGFYLKVDIYISISGILTRSVRNYSGLIKAVR